MLLLEKEEALALDLLPLFVRARACVILTGNGCNLVLERNRQVPKEFMHVCHCGKTI
jgi:hypothetical protein